MKLHSTHLKQYFLLLCLSLFTCSVAVAQGKKEIKAATAQHEFMSAKSNNSYYYPAFKKGKVTFITGTSSSGLLNYNTQTQEIEFITSKKDTLSFANMYLIDMITIENDTFYYDNTNSSLLRLMESVNGRKLLVKEQPAGNRPNGNAAAIVKTYYFSNQHDYVPATTDNFLSIFPKHSDALKSYIANNNLQLKSEADIKKLLQYASGL